MLDPSFKVIPKWYDDYNMKSKIHSSESMLDPELHDNKSFDYRLHRYQDLKIRVWDKFLPLLYENKNTSR